MTIPFSYYSTSTALPSMTKGALHSHRLVIPPLPEQHAIASFLDRETLKIDSSVAEQRRLVELLKEKRQAVISHAVTKGLDPTVPMKPSGIDWIETLSSHRKTPPVFARYFAVLGKMLDESKLTGIYPVNYLRNADVNWDTITVSQGRNKQSSAPRFRYGKTIA